MPQTSNQFQQTAEKGQVDLNSGRQTITCMVDTSEAALLVPGQGVKVVDNAGGVPKVIKIAADTDEVFGFINFQNKQGTFAAGQYVEVSFFRGNVMFMESSAAIARYAQVMPVVAGSLVATATTGKRIIGRALDKATAANQMIRVLIDVPGALAP
jgi:hypothetical protein